MKISIKNKPLTVPESKTIFRATMVKNLMFLSAQTTARVKNKQDKVLKSKYEKYSLSGGTKKQVISAATAAIHKTVFFFMNFIAAIFKPRPFFTKRCI